MNGAELLVSALENEGVEQIFGIPGRGESRRRRSAAALHDQTGADPSRAGGRFHGGDARAADRQGRGLPHDARSRRAQPHHRRGLRAARRHADGDDHRPEGNSEPQTGALSGRRHRLDHDAADQDGASDRQSGDHSHDGARGVPRRAAGAAGPGPSRTARGHRPRGGAGHVAGPAPSDRSAGRASARRSTARPS